MEKGLGGEETLVLENRNAEVDVVNAISLLGSLTLHEALSLQRTELVLDQRVLRWAVAQLGEPDKTLLFTSCMSVPTGRETNPSASANEGRTE